MNKTSLRQARGQSDRTMDVSYVLRRSATPEFFTKLFVHARSMEEEAARPRPAAGAKPRFQPTPTVTIPMPELSKYFRVNVRDVRAYVFPMPAGVSQRLIKLRDPVSLRRPLTAASEFESRRLVWGRPITHEE
eukprot:170369-Pyramimonas_sp.AAC.2